MKKTEQQHEPRRDHLLAERIFLRRDLADTPEVARLTRMSMQARLRKVEGELSVLTEGATATAQTLVADKASAGRQCTSEALDLKPRPLDPLPKNA